jgi:hypothetical protein
MYSSTHSLTSALDGGECSASRHGRFTPRGKSPWYPLDRRLRGPQSRSGCGGLEKNSQLPPGIEPQNPDRLASSPALYRLSYHGSCRHGGNDKFIQKFWFENSNGRDHSEDPGVDWKIIRGPFKKFVDWRQCAAVIFG